MARRGPHHRERIRFQYGLRGGDFCGKKSKAFFFEKKQQKTFVMLTRSRHGARTEDTKVFWFFFSKKNTLASLRPIRRSLPQVRVRFPVLLQLVE